MFSHLPQPVETARQQFAMRDPRANLETKIIRGPRNLESKLPGPTSGPAGVALQHYPGVCVYIYICVLYGDMNGYHPYNGKSHGK